MHRIGCVALAAVLGGACSSQVDRNNRFDPDGTGERAPGRITGEVFVQGFEPAGMPVFVYDDAGVRVDGDLLVTGDDGRFLTADLPAGTYSVEVEVPLGNVPVREEDIDIVPGDTVDIGLLISLAAPPTEQLTGVVEMSEAALSPADVRVVATRKSGAESRFTFTNASGTYFFDALPPGDYELRADKTRMTPDLVDVTVGAAGRALAEAPPMRLYPASGVVRFEVQTANGRVIGAPYTSSRDVDLLLLAFGGVNEMRFSESADFMEGGVEVPWRDHVAQAPIVLSDGEGAKNVSAQFRVVDTTTGAERLRTESYSATVLFDRTAPVVVSFLLAPDAQESGGVRYLTGDPSSVPVQVVAFDPYSRVAAYRFAVEGADPLLVPYEDVSSTDATATIFDLVALSPTDGEKQVALQLMDGAGNETALVTRSVVIDSEPPALLANPAVVVRGATAAQITSTTVTLQLLVGDDPANQIDGPVRMRYGLAPAPPAGAWLGFLPEVPFAFDAVHDQQVQFYGAFADNAGNEIVALSPIYRVNLRGEIAGRVLLELSPDGLSGHDGTSVAVFVPTANVEVDLPLRSGVTDPSGVFSVADIPTGSYVVRFAKSGYIDELRAPVSVSAGEITQLGTERLVAARGDLTGTFLYGDLAAGANHGGITVSALLAGRLVQTASTDSGGSVQLAGLPVANNYEIRASAPGYVTETRLGITVAEGMVQDINGGTSIALAKIAGDFKICDRDDGASSPRACSAILATNEAEVLLGFDAQSVTFVRYALEDPANPGLASFTSPTALPTADPCATPPAEQCWNPYDPATRYLVDVSAREQLATVIVQFADNSQLFPIGRSSVVYDVTPPLSPSLSIARGTAALLDGYTNSTELALTLTASATAGAVEDAAPLSTVRVSRDATWEGEGTNGDREYSYGGTKLFAAAAGDGVKDVYAWFCDGAGNCTAPAATDSITLDTAPPARAYGRDILPAGAGVTAKPAAREWWTRTTRPEVDIDVGSSLWGIPEVAGYRMSLSEQFVGAAWVELDLATILADDIVTVSGIELPPVDGDYSVWSEFVDAAGNVSTQAALDRFTLSLDTVPPGGTVTLEAGAAYTNRTLLDVGLNTDSATSIQYTWSGLLPSPDDAASLVPFAALLQASPTDLADGDKQIVVRFFDAAGNYSERSDSVFLDRSPPDPGTASASCASCSFDGAGNAFYRDLGGNVTLALFAQDNSGRIASVEVVVDAAAATPRLLSYAPFASVTVSTLETLHTLEVTYVDPAGNRTTVAPLDLEHDRTAPVPGLVINSATDEWTNDPRVQLTVSVTPVTDAANIVAMQVSNSSSFSGSPEIGYVAALDWTLLSPTADDDKSVYVRLTDAAGNVSEASDSIKLDATPPTLSPLLSGPAADGLDSQSVTRATSVQVTLGASDAGGLPSGLFEMLLANNADFSDGSWTQYASPVSAHALASPTVEGTKTVYVRVRDHAGNVTSAPASILLDTRAPTGTLRIDGGAAYTTSRTVTLDMTASTDVIKYKWAAGTIDCASVAGYVDLSLAPAVLLPDADQTYTINVCLEDAAGRTAAQSDDIVLDRQGPSGSAIGARTGISLDNDAASTANPTLSVTLAAADATTSAAEMKLSDGSGCAGGAWQPYATSASFTVEGGDGVTRSVSVQFRDPAGNVGGCYSDSIDVDTVGPNSGTISIAKGAAAVVEGYTNERAVSVALFAQGASGFRLSSDVAALDAAPLLAMAGANATASFCLEGGTAPAACNALPATAATRTIYARFYDAAGNGSAVTQASIVADASPPTGVTLGIPLVETVNFIAGEGYFTRSQILTVNASADADSGLEMQISGDGALNSEAWLELASSTSVVLSSGACTPAGLCTVRAQMRDRAGNVSSVATTEVVMDLVPPVGPKTVTPDDIVTALVYPLEIVPGVVSDPNFWRFEISGGASYPTFESSVVDLDGLASTVTSFDVDLTSNDENTLRIRAVDKAGNISDDDFTIVIHDDTPPSRPTSLEISPQNGELRLAWQPSASRDVVRYDVYYGTTSGLYNGTTAAEGASPLRVDLRTAFNLTALPNGNTIFAAVRAVDRAGNASELSSEQSGTPSVVAPRLLSQLGGRVNGAWHDPGPLADLGDDRVFVPLDGGLKVFHAQSTTEMAFLPNLADVTQVLVHGGYTYVHSSDPRLGPVPSSDDLLAGMPNTDAPIRTVSVFSTTYSGTTSTPVAYTLADVVHLPDRTAFFYITGSGASTVGVSATMGFDLDFDTETVSTFASTLTLYDPAGPGFVRRDTVDVPPVTGWVMLDANTLLVGSIEPLSVSPPEMVLGYPARLLVYQPPLVGTTQVGATFVTSPADDGQILLFGELPLTADMLFGASVNEASELSYIDVSSSPLAPVARGNPPVASDPLSLTITDSTTTSISFDATDTTLGELASLSSPALIGRTLDFGGGVTAVIQSYDMDRSTPVATFYFAPALAVAPAASSTVSLALEVPPDPDTGVAFPYGVQSFAADGASQNVFASHRVDGVYDPVLEKSLYEYSVAPAGATLAHSRDLAARVSMVRLFADWLVVAAGQSLYILPRASWWSAPLNAIPFDSFYSQILVSGGYVYGVSRGDSNGQAGFSVVDATQPTLPRMLGQVSTARPATRLAIDGSRLYVLEGNCRRCDEGGSGRRPPPDTERNCGCEEMSLETFTLAPADPATSTLFPAAKPSNPISVASQNITVGAEILDKIDDIVPYGAELLLWSQGTDVMSGPGISPTLARVTGRVDNQVPGSMQGGAEARYWSERRFGLAVSGQYAFVPSGPSASYGYGISAYRLNAGNMVEVGGTTGVHGMEVWDMQVVGETLFVFDDRGLTTYDVSQILAGAFDAGPVYPNILQLGSWRGSAARGGRVGLGYAYAVTLDGIVMIDITDPANPVEKFTIDVVAADIAIEQGMLYVTSERDGLRIYELLRPSGLRAGPHYQNGTKELSNVAVAEQRAFGRGNLTHPDDCANDARAGCNDRIKCDWSDERGTCAIDEGIWSCAIFESSGACQAERGCQWVAGVCQDLTAVTCSDLTSQQSCEASFKCKWEYPDGCFVAGRRNGCGSDMSQSQCLSDPGCNWTGTTCRDAGTVSCAGQEVSGCDAKRRCLWSAGACRVDPAPQSCAGLAMNDCFSEPGCNWNGSVCENPQNYCASTPQIDCEAKIHCLWNAGAGICDTDTSGTNSCAGVPQAQCFGEPGCSWDGASCRDGDSAGNYCRDGGAQACDNLRKCLWDEAQNSCVVGGFEYNSTDCFSIDNQSACESSASCVWWPMDSRCDRKSCWSLGAATCNSEPGCSWTGSQCTDSFPIDCTTPAADACAAAGGCVWDVDVCSPETELLVWELGVTESYSASVVAAEPLGMLPGAIASFADDSVWAFGFGNCAEGRCLDVSVYDTSSPLVLGPRRQQLAAAITPIWPVNADTGIACAGPTCCEYQECIAGQCVTPSTPQVWEVARGASTDYFALVRDANGHHPNSGIYAFSKPAAFAAPTLDGSTAVLAGANGCGAANAEVEGIFDILWTHGVLYAAGRNLISMRAASQASSDFLDFGGPASSYRRLDGTSLGMCGQHLASFGRFLYLLGTDDLGTRCSFVPGDAGASLGEGNRLWIFDLTDPIAPALVGAGSTLLPAKMNAIVAAGRYLFASEPASRRIWIINVEDPTAPDIQGAFTVIGSNSSLAVSDNQLFVNGGYTGLNAVDGR